MNLNQRKTHPMTNDLEDLQARVLALETLLLHATVLRHRATLPPQPTPADELRLMSRVVLDQDAELALALPQTPAVASHMSRIQAAVRAALR
jgi:hypothetical protein